jgi:hypothetical protein
MPPRTITSNTLFYGDNLGILREHVAGGGRVAEDTYGRTNWCVIHGHGTLVRLRAM